jgi:hypothetical protein
LYNYIKNDFSTTRYASYATNLDYLTTSSYSTSITSDEVTEDSDDITAQATTVNESNYGFNKSLNLCAAQAMRVAQAMLYDKYYYNINVFILCIIYTIQIYLIKLLLKSYTPIF